MVATNSGQVSADPIFSRLLLSQGSQVFGGCDHDARICSNFDHRAHNHLHTIGGNSPLQSFSAAAIRNVRWLALAATELNGLAGTLVKGRITTEADELVLAV